MGIGFEPQATNASQCMKWTTSSEHLCVFENWFWLQVSHYTTILLSKIRLEKGSCIFFAFTISSQMYYSCTSTASAVWIYQSSKSHNTWVNLNPLMNAKPRHKEVIYIIMNTNEYVLQDDYIPCTYKLFWRHKLLRNKVSCVSLTNLFLRNELEHSIMGLLFCESVCSDQWI